MLVVGLPKWKCGTTVWTAHSESDSSMRQYGGPCHNGTARTFSWCSKVKCKFSKQCFLKKNSWYRISWTAEWRETAEWYFRNWCGQVISRFCMYPVGCSNNSSIFLLRDALKDLTNSHWCAQVIRRFWLLLSFHRGSLGRSCVCHFGSRV